MQIREILADIIAQVEGPDRPFDHADRLIKELEVAGLEIQHQGQADWLFDDELGMHVPCCSKWHLERKCHAGPLVGEQIVTGDCGKLHFPPDGGGFFV